LVRENLLSIPNFLTRHRKARVILNQKRNKLKQRIGIAVFLLLVVVALILFRIPVLHGMGNLLVHQDPLIPADAIVVLGGSFTGNRLEEASRLFHKGFGKILVFSGYPLYPGAFNHDLMEAYALKLGVPREIIHAQIAGKERSTWGEGIANLNHLKSKNIKSFILVTSSFHTRRSRWIYEKLIEHFNYEFEMRVHPAPDPVVPIDGWWKTRVGKKQVFFEYLKTVYYYFAY